MLYTGLINRFRAQLPIASDLEAVTLHEGNTPLIPLHKLSQDTGKNIRLYAKFEGLNPTGSFKDRGMTLAVSQAKHQGMEAIMCASTGNTSAAAAAYAARAGMRCFVLIPEGKIAFGKLSQAIIHGAKVLQIAGNFDDGMELVKQLCNSMPISLVNSVNPYRLQGQKTIAYEIYDQLGEVPDYHALPVGNAANISAHWMGYCELRGEMRNFPSAIEPIYAEHSITLHKRTDKAPIMLGYQAEGSAPLVLGKPVTNPETIATAIRIGNPQSTAYARQTTKESGGWFKAYSDTRILETQKLLASTEGIFCEPASAVSLAGVLDDIANDKIAPNSSVVCTLTGNGIKDPDTVVQHQVRKEDLLQVDANFEDIQRLITS